MNSVQLVGNLGADPEVRTTTSGATVANFRLATNERKKEGDQWVEHTEWHRVTCFGRTAENLGKYKRKGDTLAIEGRLSTRKWQDRDGNDRWTTEIIAHRVHYVGGKGGGGDDTTQRGGSSSGGYGGDNRGGAPDDDIPF